MGWEQTRGMFIFMSAFILVSSTFILAVPELSAIQDLGYSSKEQINQFVDAQQFTASKNNLSYVVDVKSSNVTSQLTAWADRNDTTLETGIFIIDFTVRTFNWVKDFLITIVGFASGTGYSALIRGFIIHDNLVFLWWLPFAVQILWLLLYGTAMIGMFMRS